jgi:TPR repeat protein
MKPSVDTAISLDTAIIVTDTSKRTLWRRLSEGKIAREEDDERGRAMLDFEGILPMLCVSIAPEDHELFFNADAGDAEAQNDLALLFLESDRPDVALHWLQLAVAQDHADAMHNLGRLYIKGIGIPKNDNLGLMWLAKAAAFGHVIAERQLTALKGVWKAE